MSSVTINTDVTVGGTLKDLKHTYPVTVANSKFVVKYLSGQSGTLTTQYNDEDHDNTSSNGLDYSFWLKGAGMYRFDQSDSSNSGHRLKFSTVSDGTHTSGGIEWVGTINPGSGHDSYVTGVSYSGTPGSAGAYTEINVQSTPWHNLSPYNTPPLYVYCDAHSGMGFGPIRADLTYFTLEGLKYELLNGVGTTWTAISSNLPSLNANQTFNGVQTFDDEVTFRDETLFESATTVQDNIIIKDGSNTTKFTFNKDGRIGIGSSVAYGTSGQVLTSGGSGAVSWADASSSGAGLGANTFTGTQTISNATSGASALTINNTANNKVHIWPETTFYGNVQQAGTISRFKVGAVASETYSTFTSGSVPSVRGEVDGNFVVKGTHTTGSGDAQTTVKNAVYSDEYKNLAGEKIIVPSTAFDPTEDERTGSMKAIRDYIGTLIDIEPPVFAGGRFASGGATSYSASVGDTFDPFFSYPVPVAGQMTYNGTTYTLGSSYSFPITSSSSTKTIARADLGSPTWDGWGSDKAWTLYYQYTTPATAPSSPLDTNGFMRFSNEGGAQDVWVGTQTIDSSGNRLNVFYFNGSWSEYIGSPSNPMYLSYSFAASTKYSVVIAFDGTSNAGSQPDADQFDVYIRDDTNSGNWSTAYNFTSNLDTWTATDSALDMTSHDLVLVSPTTNWSASDYGSIHALGFWNTKLNAAHLAAFDSTTITCTDSPTAGPNKGTTQTFTLGADHFEFRNAVAGATVLPIANVFDNLSNGAWQASSTWKTAGTYYLRYKATDAAGNDTPNDASHYLTVTVPVAPVVSRSTAVTGSSLFSLSSTQISAWNGWLLDEDWALNFKFKSVSVPTSAGAATLFNFTLSTTSTAVGVNLQQFPTEYKFRLNHNSGASPGQLSFDMSNSTISAGDVQWLFSYNKQGYTAGGGDNDPAWSTTTNGAGLSAYYRMSTNGGSSYGSWTQITSGGDSLTEATYVTKHQVGIFGAWDSSGQYPLLSNSEITDIQMWNVVREPSDL